MKTIIAPIDFSDASNNALLFAAELSKRTSAQLIIAHIHQDGQDKTEITNKLEYAISNLHQKFGDDLSCQSVVMQGKMVETLKGLIGLHQPNLLVMGTKGASGLKKVLIGSNTVQVLANVKTPVLVIPEVARFEKFLDTGKNRVVLATDLEQLNNENALDILKEIALLIKEPEIRVVSVRPKDKDLDDQKREERSELVSLFEPEIPSDWITVFSSSVLNGINFYLDRRKDTGLLAMVARDSGHLIQKHYTREMASHTELPLLVMHDV